VAVYDTNGPVGLAQSVVGGQTLAQVLGAFGMPVVEIFPYFQWVIDLESPVTTVFNHGSGTVVAKAASGIYYTFDASSNGLPATASGVDGFVAAATLGAVSYSVTPAASGSGQTLTSSSDNSSIAVPSVV